MTTVVTPKFIIDLFENELSNILLQTLNCISMQFDIDIGKLKKVCSETLKKPLEIIPEEFEQVRIIRKKKKKQLCEEDRCKGIVKSDGIIRQCSFAHNCDSDYCTRHFKKYMENPNVFDELIRKKQSCSKTLKVKKIY